MNCDDLLAKLTDYTEGASDADLCAEIERHLAGCAPCETLRKDLLDLRRLCRSCDPPKLPGDARARIEKLLRREKEG
jgi:RNA polymerase sigma-70 factor, ECF subfamily